VVTAGKALRAVPTRSAGLDGNSVARFDVRDLGSDGFDLTRNLMSEDERAGDNVVADATNFEVRGVRTAYSDRFDANHGLSGARGGHRALLDPDLA